MAVPLIPSMATSHQTSRLNIMYTIHNNTSNASLQETSNHQNNISPTLVDDLVANHAASHNVASKGVDKATPCLIKRLIKLKRKR